MLDYDGTLAPFRKQRDQARPYDGVEQCLDELILAEKTRIVIVSGRAIEDLKPLLKLKKYPEIRGSHGWESLAEDGSYTIMDRGKNHIDGLKRAKEFIFENHLEEYMEIKPASIAIHYRGISLNKVLEIEKAILYNWRQLEADFQLSFSRFDGGLELMIPGVNKGDVVKTIIRGHPESTVAAYLGDDFTDEDAFRALPDRALGVLVRSEPRETGARVWIKPPEELLDFLNRWISVDRSG